MILVDKDAKSKPSLSEIEKGLTRLWTDKEARQRYLAGDKSDVSQNVANTVDYKSVKIYSSLLEIGRTDLMTSIFPCCARLLRASWKRVVDDYFKRFPPHHFNLNRSAKDFALYLSQEFGAEFQERYPYLSELADYEWIELEALEDEAEIEVGDWIALERPEQFQELGPILNNTLILRDYSYELPALVEKLKSGKSIPKSIKPQKTHIAAFRDPSTVSGTYLELDTAALNVIKSLLEAPGSFADLIGVFVASCPGSDPQQTVVRALSLVEDLREHRLFVATRKLG